MGDHKAQMAARWLWVVLVVAGAASVSVTDEVGSTSRLLNADLDQPLMSVLGREDVRLAVRNVKVDSASRRPLADLQLEIDLGMADLGGDDLGMANLLTSEEDLGEERRFDFEPNKKEAQNMDVQKILGYDKLLDETEANYLAATDIVIKSKLKWQTDSIINLLRAACTRYIQILKPELWSPLKQKLRTAKYTVFVTCGKLLHTEKPITNSTGVNHKDAIAAAKADLIAAKALNQTDQIELAAKTLTSATKASAESKEAADAESAALEAAKSKESAAAAAAAKVAAAQAKKAKEAAYKQAYLDGTVEPPEYGTGRMGWILKEKDEKRKEKILQKLGPEERAAEVQRRTAAKAAKAAAAKKAAEKAAKKAAKKAAEKAAKTAAKKAAEKAAKT